jgi:fucose 4-O-acetylase-like acetyltransferase
MGETRNRIAWVDYLKGIGIFFIVLGHDPCFL